MDVKSAAPLVDGSSDSSRRGSRRVLRHRANCEISLNQYAIVIRIVGRGPAAGLVERNTCGLKGILLLSSAFA